ncbi:SpoIIE family protein phosphatase [Micromonosporaceae bacterium DT194]|uniref:ATP-binding SpoIIE family protein phosphatase n=1 Tax=Melissospora conviva TaxID=3388432 RepID=UPI003C188F99
MSSAPAAEHGDGSYAGSDQLSTMLSAAPTTSDAVPFPAEFPEVPGTALAGRYLPGTLDLEVGGDWYDVLPLDSERLLLVVGEVTARGLAGVAPIRQVRDVLRAAARDNCDPGAVLTRLNQAAVDGDGWAASVICLIFDPAGGELRYASAGHPPPLVISGAELRLLYDRALGPLIGALPTAAYEVRDDRLEVGDRLLLYTGGLVEQHGAGADLLGRVRVAAAEPAERLPDLLDAVARVVTERPGHDDVALLALEAVESSGFALRLPADPTKLSLLRKRLERFLVAHRVGETDLFDLTVAVSEAAANAIEHPIDPREPVIEVEVSIRDRSVLVTVRDTGQWRESTDAGFRGRGLSLINALGELVVRRTPQGTELSLRRRLAD